MLSPSCCKFQVANSFEVRKNKEKYIQNITSIHHSKDFNFTVIRKIAHRLVQYTLFKKKEHRFWLK